MSTSHAARLPHSIPRWPVVGTIAAAATLTATLASGQAWWLSALAALTLTACAWAWRTAGPGSPRARFVTAIPPMPATTGRLITVADVDALPPAAATFLRTSGVIGTPIPTTMGADISGRIRTSHTSPWMPFTGAQVNTFSPDSTRQFAIHAHLYGIPVTGLHHQHNADASMRITAAGIVPVGFSGGEALGRAEAVTFLNDMCCLALGALLHAPITWEHLDDTSAHLTYEHHGHTVTATIHIDADGKLVDFRSKDRLMDNGRGEHIPAAWATPIHAWQTHHGVTICAAGSATWDTGDGPWPYLDLTFDHITIDGR